MQRIQCPTVRRGGGGGGGWALSRGLALINFIGLQDGRLCDYLK